MLDKVLRPPKERLLVPAARLTQRVHPTVLTLIAFGVGVLAVGAVLLHEPPLALGLWLTNRVLDGLDGSAARFQARQSDFGGYLDILLDTVIYAALPTALVIAAPVASRIRKRGALARGVLPQRCVVALPGGALRKASAGRGSTR